MVIRATRRVNVDRVQYVLDAAARSASRFDNAAVGDLVKGNLFKE